MEKEQSFKSKDEKDQSIDLNDNKNQDKIKTEKENSSTDEDKKEEKKVSLEDMLKDTEDKLARTLAEMENQRRRFEKEREDAFEYGGFIFAKEALSIIDNLERSKQVLENDETLKNTEALKKILEHLKILNDDLISIFSKNNIQPIKCLNKKLDPNFHQAMMEIEDNDKEPGTIIQEIQKGFTIKDRLLRPSLVGVSKNTAKIDQKVKKNNENIENK